MKLAEQASIYYADGRKLEVGSPREMERLREAFMAGAAWMWVEVQRVGETTLPPTGGAEQ